MKSRTSISLLASAVALLVPTVSLAGESPVRETPTQACDKLAGHPADPAKPADVEGTDTGDIMVDIAIEACTLALADEPDNPRLHYQLGRAYFDKTYYGSAFREFSIASDAGYAAARGALGYLYDEALGTVADKAKAVALYRQAADGKVSFAAHNLGVMLREGTGAPVDYDASLRYFRMAADLGYRQSLVDIGFAYDNGYGVPQDYAEAMRWYRLAAKDNIPEALNNIGALYEDGHGVPLNTTEAAHYYQMAIAQDYSLAYFNLGHMVDSKGGKDAPRLAVNAVLEGLKAGNAADDAFNVKYMLDEAEWTPGFWTEIQTRLAASHGYKGAVDGKPSAETRAAIEALMDK